MNPIYKSVPLAEIAAIVLQELVPLSYQTKRTNLPSVFQVEFISAAFKQIEFKLVYVERERTLLDRLLKRTRYEIAALQSKEFGNVLLSTVDTTQGISDKPKGLEVLHVTTLQAIYDYH